MYKKNSIEFLIKRIKSATGLNQEGIAKSINYSRPHLSAMKKSSPDELYDLLEKHFGNILSTKYLLEESAAKYDTTEHENEDRAMLQVLFLEVAKLKSKVFGISVEDAIDELEKNIKIALRKHQPK